MTTTVSRFEPISCKLWKQDPKAFAERLGQGFRETGFAVPHDHPNDPSMTHPGFRPWQKVFALPD